MPLTCSQRPPQGPNRVMWITPDRVYYLGLLGTPSVRTMGSIIVYVAVAGSIRIRIGDGLWQSTEMAVVPPYVPHQIESQQRLINAIKIEAETVDMSALPAELRASGAVHAPDFVRRVQQLQWELSERGKSVDLMTLDFDQTFFQTALAPRTMDHRVATVLGRIKRDPAAPAVAEEFADLMHLSFSRFLHLFKQEVGAPFRSFRTWKRARNLLHYVNQDANLAARAPGPPPI